MARHGPKPTSPSEAIHVVRGDGRSPTGARDVVALYDSLTLGPCHTNAELHGVLRSEYWHSFESDSDRLSLELLNHELRKLNKAVRDVPTPKIRTSEELVAALTGFPESLPIVLWTSPDAGDRLAFWLMLDALVRGNIATARRWVADSRYPEDGPDALLSYHAQPDTIIQDAFAGITPLTRTRARRGASLWAKYASPSPVALDRVRRSGTLEAVDTRVISDLFFWGLPRVIDTEESRLRLSEFDQLLLGRLKDRKWVRPLDVLLSVLDKSHTHPTFLQYGDRVFSQRLAAWVGHQAEEPSLVGRTVLDRGNALQRVAYCLTPKGRRIVNIGLDEPAEAPEFHVGGCRVYRGTPVWARHIVGIEWQVKSWR